MIAPDTASRDAIGIRSLPERLHGLDAVRAIALLLGVVLHAALSFVPGTQGWIVLDIDRSFTAAVAAYVIHMFRMTLFFLLAGFFARLSFHRLGRAAFIRDRIRRIAVPLVVAWPITLAAVAAVIAWTAAIAARDGMPPVRSPAPTFMPDDFPMVHLWFLWMLLLLYAAMLGTRATVDAFDRQNRLRPQLDRLTRFLVASRTPMLLALPLALVLFVQDPWLVSRGIPSADHSLLANVPSWVAYGSAFAVGWLIHRQRDLLELLQRRWRWNLGLALCATLACLAVLLQDLGPTLAGHDGIRFAYAGFYAVGAWSWSLALIGVGLRFMSGFSPFWQYIAAASYWVYLVHLPVILVLQVLVAQLRWPWGIKLALILSIGSAIMFASYQLLVRYTAIGALLGGKRRLRAGAASA